MNYELKSGEPYHRENEVWRHPITCPLNRHQQYIGNKDLDFNIHKGFTIGKGKKLYWMMIWWSTGNATVYGVDDLSPRWVANDTIIKIHFKNENKEPTY